MARLLCTIWPLILNACGFSIFQTCFGNAMEDEEGESLLSGPPFTSLLFSLGIYTIIMSSTLFPPTFREPKAVFLIMYEFLATAFLLEFAIACIWTPIDVLILTTLPNRICQLLNKFGHGDIADAFLANKSAMAVVTYTVALTFLLVALYVTDAVDFTILRDYGAQTFASNLKEKLWDRVQREFPKLQENKSCYCKTRKRSRSNSRGNNSKAS